MSILKQEAVNIIENMREYVMAEVVDYLRNISNENSQSSERIEGYRILQSFAGILPSDFDYKKELEAMREESSQDKQKRLEYEAREKAVRNYNQGLLEAEDRGVKLGIQQGAQRVNALNALLLRDKRYDDLFRSTNDSDFQQQLMIHYGL